MSGGGRQGNGRQPGDYGGLALSADARYVAFTSDASTLVDVDTNRQTDVFVRDRATGTTERVREQCR